VEKEEGPQTPFLLSGYGANIGSRLLPSDEEGEDSKKKKRPRAASLPVDEAEAMLSWTRRTMPTD